MDDDSTIQTETENQRLTSNRNNNYTNERTITDSYRFERVFNPTNFFKYISLLIMIFIMFFVIALNKVHNVDYKKFNYTKNSLLQIYLNSIMDTMKTTFNDNNIIDLDQHLENNKSFEPMIEIKNNLSLLNQIEEKKEQSKDEKQEVQVLIKNRHLTFRENKSDEALNSSSNSNFNKDIKDDNNFLNEEFISANDEKNSKKLFLKSEKKNSKLNHNSGNIFSNSDQEDFQEKQIIEKSSAASKTKNTTNNNATSIPDKNITSNLNENQSITDPHKSNTTTNNTITEENNSEKNQITEKLECNPGEVYYFMNNITQYEYSGKWKGCNPNNMFEQSEGAMSMEIRKNQSQQVFNVIPNIEFFRILEFTFNAKDGDYRDNWMVFNFTLKFPKDFHKNFWVQENNSSNVDDNKVNNDLLKEVKVKDRIVLVEDKVQIRYYIAELFETKNITQCNNSRVELEFVRAPIFKVENFDDINSIEFSQINGKISDPDCEFKFDFSLQIETEEVLLLFLFFYLLITISYSVIFKIIKT